MKFGLLFSHRNPPQWKIPYEKVMSSMELFAKEVMPHFRETVPSG